MAFVIAIEDDRYFVPILAVAGLSLLSCGAVAVAFSRSRGGNNSNRTIPGGKKKNHSLSPPNFYSVAERIGKTILRPGGSAATERLHLNANLSPGTTVLELAAGYGKSGIMLAKKYGCQVTISDIDRSRLEMASRLVANDDMGLKDLVTVKEVDMFEIDSTLGVDAKYDAAQIEAAITHYPRSRKVKFFEGVAKHADKILLHEMCFKTEDIYMQDYVKKEMSKVLNNGFVPETEKDWKDLLKGSGFDIIEYVEIGEVGLVSPLDLIREEGPMRFLLIALNVLTHPYYRSRMLATKRALVKHSNHLGYITIVASKKKKN